MYKGLGNIMCSFKDLKLIRNAYREVIEMCKCKITTRDLILTAIDIYNTAKELELKLIDELLNSSLDIEEFNLYYCNLKVLKSHSDKASNVLNYCRLITI